METRTRHQTAWGTHGVQTGRPAGIRPWGAYKDTGRTLEQWEAVAGYCTGWLEGLGCASWRRNGSSDLFLSALWAEGADETAALGPTVEIE